jgi:hypothetical protein
MFLSFGLRDHGVKTWAGTGFARDATGANPPAREIWPCL